MKKIILFFALTSFSELCFCQLSNYSSKDTSSNKVKFGIRFGINLSNVQLEYDILNTYFSEKPNFKQGFTWYFFSNIYLNKRLIFQPAISLIDKGMHENFVYGDFNNTFTYIEVPLNLLLYKSISKKGSLFLGGGPAIAYLINHNHSDFISIKNHDFGINFLTGYVFSKKISVNLNYTHSFINISTYEFFSPVIRNRSFGLSMGYGF